MQTQGHFSARWHQHMRKQWCSLQLQMCRTAEGPPRIPQFFPQSSEFCVLHPPRVLTELISASYKVAATLLGFISSHWERGTEIHESLSLSPAGRMTMKNYALEGFSLARLTQLNAYSIITEGKRMFLEKKHNPNKNTPPNPNKLTRFCKLLMVELAILLKQVTRIGSTKAKTYPEVWF